MTSFQSIRRIVALLILALGCLAFSSGAQAQVRWQNSVQCTFSNGVCTWFYAVPSGQRLNIEYISTYCNAPAGAADLVMIGVTFNGNGGPWQAVSLNQASNGMTINSSMVNIYADQNTYVYLDIQRQAGASNGSLCDMLISGHIDKNVTQ